MDIRSQLPEYIKGEYPDFLKFVNFYFDFLKSEEIYYSDLSGTFNKDDILSGLTSNSTAKILGHDPANKRIFIERNTPFNLGEVISNESGASAVLENYNSGAGLTIDDLLNYRNLDATNERMIKKFRHDLMSVINGNLNSKVDVQNLIKNIKDLYTAKGTEDSFKTIFSLLFDEYVEIYYPSRDILRVSDGKWIGRHSIKGVILTGDPLTMIGGAVTLNNQIVGSSRSIQVYKVVRLSATEFQMYYSNVIEDIYKAEDVVIVGTNFSGKIGSDAEITYTGQYEGSEGFLSDSNYLQNDYYQKYSYAIRSNVVSTAYDPIIKNAIHPAGLVAFNELVISNNLSISEAIRIIKAEFTKVFGENILTLDNLTALINKILPPDAVTLNDEVGLTINKDVEDSSSITITDAQTYIDINPYAVDYFYQPSVKTDAYTDSREL